MFIGHSGANKKDISEIIRKKDAKIYFIGIGGVGMFSLAKMSLSLGLRVFGSERQRSTLTDELISAGARVGFSHQASEIHRIMPNIVVYTLAIGDDNCEYRAAKALGILTVSRAEYLGALMGDFACPIGISGSHGKSTVCAMLYRIFSHAGLQPSAACGAPIEGASPSVIGKRDYLLYEACEYGDSFLHFSPAVSVILSVELDHTDYFKTLDDIKKSYLCAANLASSFAVLNADDENIASFIDFIKPTCVTYSKKDGATYRYKTAPLEGGRYSVKLYKSFDVIAEFEMKIAGEFNAQNAVSAAVLADALGLDMRVVSEALSGFLGIPRRLELIAHALGADVFYDYAHHPTEIRSTLSALRSMGYKNICAIFAPHTYTRTKSFFSCFADELSRFDSVFIKDVYAAREAPIVGVCASSLAEEVRKRGAKAYAIGDGEFWDMDILGADCLVLMGAGDLDNIKNKILLKKE